MEKSVSRDTVSQDRWENTRPLRAIIGGALPLDPPPFFLEAEIHEGESRDGLLSVALGLLILGAFFVIYPEAERTPVSFAILFLVSVAAACFYAAVRLFAYWWVWVRATRRYPLIGTVHPAARGELPRNSYVVVTFAPMIAFAAVWSVITWLVPPSTPALWLGPAVVAGIALRDARAGRRLLRLSSSYWIKRTKNGLDVLRPIRSL